jgi:hypothetical protein
MHEGRENQINNLQKFIDVPATKLLQKQAAYYRRYLPLA